MLHKPLGRNQSQRQVRKKRKPIACARCRRLKRRCDRANPCLSCKSSGKECRLYDLPEPVINSAEGSDVEHSSSGSKRGSLDEPSLLAMLRDHQLVDVLLRIWFSYLDFMYDSAVETRLHHLWMRRQLESLTASSHLRPLISIILALTCQLAPERIGSAIASCSTAWCSVDRLVTMSFEYARRASDAYFEACDLSCNVDLALIDHLHASLLIAAYLKNADRVIEYRTRLSRDIAFLQCIHIHTLGDVPQGATRSCVTEMARRLWWSYFQYDRFYWLMDQSFPFMVRRGHCDISFLDDTGLQHHISCQAADADSASTLPIFKLGRSHGARAQGAGETCFSEFSSNMICIALAAEHVSDRMADLARLAAPLETHSREEMRLESAIDKTVAEFNSLFLVLERQQSSLLCTADRSLSQIRQDQVASITLDTLRYRACSALASCASRLSVNVKNRLCLVRAQATATLVQRALELTAGLSPSELRWAFFINYIGQSTADLARLVLEPSLQQATSHRWVGLLVRSRNFLCLIADQNKDHLPRRVAQGVCLDTAKIFSGVDESLKAQLSDIHKTKVDSVSAEQIWQVHQLQQDKGFSLPDISGATSNDLILPDEHELLQQIISLEALEDLFAISA